MSCARITAFSKALRKWSQSEVQKTSPSAFEPRRASTASARLLRGISRRRRFFVSALPSRITPTALPSQAIVGQWLSSFKEFPIRQKPASFNLDDVMRKLSGPQGGGK